MDCGHSVKVCTRGCDPLSTGSNPVDHPNLLDAGAIVAHLSYKEDVPGASPGCPTNLPITQLDRVSVS